jgi:hypothetical protein
VNVRFSNRAFRSSSKFLSDVFALTWVTLLFAVSIGSYTIGEPLHAWGGAVVESLAFGRA